MKKSASQLSKVLFCFFPVDFPSGFLPWDFFLRISSSWFFLRIFFLRIFPQGFHPALGSSGMYWMRLIPCAPSLSHPSRNSRISPLWDFQPRRISCSRFSSCCPFECPPCLWFPGYRLWSRAPSENPPEPSVIFRSWPDNYIGAQGGLRAGIFPCLESPRRSQPGSRKIPGRNGAIPDGGGSALSLWNSQGCSHVVTFGKEPHFSSSAWSLQELQIILDFLWTCEDPLG